MQKESKPPPRNLDVYVIVVGALIAAALGLNALLGYALGVGAGLFGAMTLYFVQRLFADVASVKPIAIGFILLAFLVKFPLIGILGYVSYLQGELALAVFTVAVVLVYSGLVWRASTSKLF